MHDTIERAEAALLAGRLGEAERLCAEAVGRAPDDPAALRQLGLLRLVQGEPAAALALLAPLRRALPDDARLGIALGEAAWATGSASEAVAQFRAVLAREPHRLALRARLGAALLAADDPAAARAELEQVVQVQPDHPALTHLGAALLALGDAAGAVAALRRAAALTPADPAPALHLGLALRALGRLDAAQAALQEAARRDPARADVRVALGEAWLAAGRPAIALSELRRAVALDPACALAWAKLGDAEQLGGDPAAALGCYRRATALDPADPALRALLGNALVAAGDTAGGGAELARSMAARWAAAARRGARLRVGILAAPGIANTPTDYLIDRVCHTVEPLFLVDGLAYPHDAIRAAHDVLFNAASDPDAAARALAVAQPLVAVPRLPVVNPPQAMADTARDRVAGRLAGIDGLLVPRTRRHGRADVAALDDIPGPVLVRPAGGHGGQDTAIAETAAELRALAAGLPDRDLYLTEYLDMRNDDGLYRKLRLVFVDGVAFPLHLAIGDHWLGHYFRSRMAERASLRAEEAAFLRRPEGYLGQAGWTALVEAAGRVRLDFFGIDAGLDRHGRLVRRARCSEVPGLGLADERPQPEIDQIRGAGIFHHAERQGRGHQHG